MAETTKPQDEIVVKFSKDHDGNIIIVFFDAHGALKSEVEKAGLPVKASGKDAIKLTGKVGSLVKALGLARHSFKTRTGGMYVSYHPLAG